jgi:hypothetical protein
MGWNYLEGGIADTEYSPKTPLVGSGEFGVKE